MDIYTAIILGSIEGISEFLPISSTGHLILANAVLNVQPTEFVKSFEIAIQSAAILPIIFTYIHTLLKQPKRLYSIGLSFIPTAIIGFLMYKTIKTYFFENTSIVAISLIIGGIGIYCMEKFFVPSTKTTINNLTWIQAILIGVMQSFSVIPGVSRSASSILGSRLLGLSRQEAVEYSFLLAVPTILAATVYDFMKVSFQFSKDEYSLLVVGSITSFIVSWLVIRSFLRYIQQHTFIIFAYYRIAIGIVLLVFR